MASCRAVRASARAITEVGSRSLITSPIGTDRLGSTSGTARMPRGTPNTCSQAYGTMLAQRPVLTWANSAATESVSTLGSGRSPASAKTSSITRRPCIEGASRQSGSRDASAQVAVGRPARSSTVLVSSTCRSW